MSWTGRSGGQTRGKTLNIYYYLNKTQVDNWLQKLDKDFIGNWITYLFYTYFINDTRFYIFCQHYSIIWQQKKRQKNKSIQNKTKTEVRMEYKIISSQDWVSPLRHFKHWLNGNKLCIQNRSTQNGKMLTKRVKKGWKPMKMTGEGKVSLRLFLRT